MVKPHANACRNRVAIIGSRGQDSAPRRRSLGTAADVEANAARPRSRAAHSAQRWRPLLHWHAAVRRREAAHRQRPGLDRGIRHLGHTGPWMGRSRSSREWRERPAKVQPLVPCGAPPRDRTPLAARQPHHLQPRQEWRLDRVHVGVCRPHAAAARCRPVPARDDRQSRLYDERRAEQAGPGQAGRWEAG